MLPQHLNCNATVSEIVRADYRAADVFKKHGINYCCSGQVMLQQACDMRKISYEEVVAELGMATRSMRLPNSLQFGEWKMDFLADYISNVHHAYLYNMLPDLGNRMSSFIEGHKKKFPVLLEMQCTFSELSRILLMHMPLEDEIIFPYIKQIEAARRRNEPYGHLFVRTLRKPLGEVEKVHEEISSLLKQLKVTSNDFNFPSNACTNHQVVYHKLREFYDDMVQHIHLENNILYPKVIETERQLLGK